MEQKFEFAVNEFVLVMQGPQLYQGKISNTKETNDGRKYKIHYIGWHSRYDEWVYEDRMFENNVENRAYQRELKLKAINAAQTEVQEQTVGVKRKPGKPKGVWSKKAKQIKKEEPVDTSIAHLSPSVSDWTDADVGGWLMGVSPGLKSCVDLFAKNAVNGKLLIRLDEELLKEIGVQNTLHRLRLLEEISILKRDGCYQKNPDVL
eukprot:203038_1